MLILTACKGCVPTSLRVQPGHHQTSAAAIFRRQPLISRAMSGGGDAASKIDKAADKAQGSGSDESRTPKAGFSDKQVDSNTGFARKWPTLSVGCRTQRQVGMQRAPSTQQLRRQRGRARMSLRLRMTLPALPLKVQTLSSHQGCPGRRPACLFFGRRITSRMCGEKDTARKPAWVDVLIWQLI